MVRFRPAKYLLRWVQFTACIALMLMVAPHMPWRGTLRGWDCRQVIQPTPSQVLHHHEVWQVLQDDHHEVYAYSAIYDDRPAGGPLPYIRILAVGTKIQTDLFCQFWYNSSNPYVTVAKVQANGGKHTIKEVSYHQYFFSCNAPENMPPPSHVSVVLGQACALSTVLLPVIRPERDPEDHHQFGVCVPISFWHVDPFRLIEWLEMTHLLGVTEVNVYACNMSSVSLQVLHHYQAKGLVNLINMPSPKQPINRDGVKLASPISLNDCMWRNMYKYNYVIPVDFDEVILPIQPLNYSNMLSQVNDQLKLQHPAISYTFRNTYFWTGCEKETLPGLLGRLYMLRLARRDQSSKYLYSAKSIVNPRHCLSVFNHYCWVRFPSAPDRWTVDVPQSIARLHHYREVYASRDCPDIQHRTVEDRTVAPYAETLLARIKEAVAEIGLDIKVD